MSEQEKKLTAYLWHEQQNGQKTLKVDSPRHSMGLVYLPTFTPKLPSFVGKYTPIECLGPVAFLGFYVS